MSLTLQINTRYKKYSHVSRFESMGIYITPPIGGDNDWICRVDVGHGQAIIAFPKFGTVGIRFEKERDWNTNLPYVESAEMIYNHIKHNRWITWAKGKIPKKKDCIAAIKSAQRFAEFYVKRI